eukprot:COSAG05_NODE_1792_length_4082_cov_3.402963_2_plen_35_part_00
MDPFVENTTREVGYSKADRVVRQLARGVRFLLCL